MPDTEELCKTDRHDFSVCAADEVAAPLKPAPAAPSPGAIRSAVTGILDDFGAMVEKRPEPAMVALLILYVAVVAMNNHRSLWYDELTTNMPALVHTRMNWGLRALQHPFLSVLLTSWSAAILGSSNWAVRLPATLGYLAASGCIFIFLRRLRAGNLYALFGVLLFWSTSTLYYATEARPYGIILGLAAGLLVAWHRAVTEERRTGALVAIALSDLFLIYSHPLAILALLPILCAEASRFRLHRKTDWPLWLCAGWPAVGIVPIFLIHPIHPKYSPLLNGRLSNGVLFYSDILQSVAPAIMLAALGALLAGRFNRKDPDRQEPVDSTLVALITGGLAIPFAVNGILAATLTNPYYPRYAISGALAVPVGAALLLARTSGRNVRAGAAALLAALGFFLINTIQRQYPEVWNAPPVAESEMIRSRPALPVVAASGLTFVEMANREPAAFLSRLYYLQDPAGAVRYADSALFESGEFNEYFTHLKTSGTIEPYGAFLREHPKFLVYGTVNYWEDWLLRRLMAEGAQVVWLGQVHGTYKDVDLYEITVSGGR